MVQNRKHFFGEKHPDDLEFKSYRTTVDLFVWKNVFKTLKTVEIITILKDILN